MKICYISNSAAPQVTQQLQTAKLIGLSKLGHEVN